MEKNLRKDSYAEHKVKLLIISNMAHYYKDGQLVGHGPTATEISYLSNIFEEVTHIGCLHSGTAPDLFLPYRCDNIKFVPLVPTGGKHFWNKLQILMYVPVYAQQILRELSKADVVHIRAPANIPLIAVVLLAFVQNPKIRWIKYAGNWQPDKPDALSYRFQRWWLRRGWHQGIVTVNGEWPNSPPFVRSFVNPCLTEEQLLRGRKVAAEKHIQTPIHIVFVGRVDEAKGIGRIIDVAHRLNDTELDFAIDIIGDGPERQKFEDEARIKRVTDRIHFHGWLARDQVDTFYEKAHFILFPSTSSEGWPKVLSEAMAFGVVPLASNISSIPYFIENAEAGKTLPANDIEGFVQAILGYVNNPDAWKQASQNGLKLAERFSYQNYLNDVRKLIEDAK